MATWIAHLRLAEELMRSIPDLNAEAFAVGNIAPDSGIPDEKWEKFTPDPKVTHFTAGQGSSYSCCDLDFYRQYLLPLKAQPMEHAGVIDTAFSFRLGYFFHLVTDNLWSIKIGRPTMQRYPQEFAADPNFIWEVKEDWYGQDFRYVQSHPESLFWTVFLQAKAQTAGLDFLPIDALRQRVAYIQEYYQRTDQEIVNQTARPMIYLPTETMDAFVANTSNTLLTIYQTLWLGGLEIGGCLSSLDLLP